MLSGNLVRFQQSRQSVSNIRGLWARETAALLSVREGNQPRKLGLARSQGERWQVVMARAFAETDP